MNNRMTVFAGAVAIALTAISMTPAMAAPGGGGHSGPSHPTVGSSNGGGGMGSSFHEGRSFRFNDSIQLPDHPAADPSCYYGRHSADYNPYACEAN